MAAPGAGPEAAAGGPLLAAIVALSRHFGRPVSPDAILSGLPSTDGSVSPSLFARASERADLAAEPARRPLADLPNLVLPAVLVLRDGSALLLLHGDASGGVATVLRPSLERSAEEPAQTVPLSELAERYSGYCFLVTRRASPGRDGAAETGGQHWFWGTLARFRGSYLTIALASLLINLAALSFPLFVMNVYDRVLPNGAIASLVALSLGVLLATGFDLALRIVRSRMIDFATKQVDVTLAARIFSQLLGLKLANRPGQAGALANQIREFETVRDFFTSSTVLSASDLLFAFVFIAVMFVIVGPLAWVPLLLLPLSLAIGLALQWPLNSALSQVQAETASRQGVLVESLGALETIRALGAEARVQARWERSVAASARASEAVHHWSSLTLTLANTAQNLATLLVVVWGVFLVIGNQITAGALVAATMLSGRILAPVTNLAGIVMRAGRTLHALRAIDRIMNLEVERPPGKVFTGRRVESGSIAFRHVSFSYPGAATSALSDVSFSIAPGERVGVVGRIGSGKTTLGRLLAGFYEPSQGRILVDEVDLRQYDPSDLRAGVGFVLQDCALFHGTVRDNITAGRPTASGDELIAASRMAGVEAFAGGWPLGYDMPVAEGGQSLSGGQRQAIALARALIRKPRILFLDEPTSALDMRSEAEFCERLSGLGPDLSLIVSTHRFSLLRLVDRVLVFDEGRLVADGPRDQILARLQGRAANDVASPVRAREASDAAV